MLLFELIAGKKAVIDQAVAGFVLHPDAVLAQSVAEALAASATQTPVESLLIERLVRMRPWLPQTRQAHSRRNHTGHAVKRLIAGQNGVAKGHQVLCLGLRWLGHEKSLRHTKGRRSLPTCKRHDEACRCCRCCGSSRTIKIRNGRYGSSNEVLHADDGNRFSWHYPDVGTGDCRQFRLWDSAAVQIGRGGGESRSWPGSSRSRFANGNYNGSLG